MDSGGVAYTFDEHNADILPAAHRAVADSLSAEIIAGKIRVPRE